MSVYNWGATRNAALPTNDNTTKPGFANNQGMASLQGVHTSDLAYGNTADGIIGARLQPESYYSSLFLERKRLKGEDLVFASYAEVRDIPKGNSQITLKRYQPLRAHIVPLVEGRKPAPDFAGGKAIVANTRAYGRYMEFTDQFDIKVMDPVIEEYTTELGDVAAETIDLLAQAALIAEAQQFFPAASGATSTKTLVDKAATNTATSNTTKPTIEDLRLIGLYMEAAKVPKINGKYHVLASPAVLYDLQTELFDKNLNALGTQSTYASNMMPDIFGLKFVKAASARTVTASGTAPSTGDAPTAVVHHTIVLGGKAFTKVEIAGNGNVQFFTKALGSAGTTDPINQRQTMGWKINSIGFKTTDPDAVVDYLTVPTQSEVITGGFDYVSGNDLASYGVTPEMKLQIEKLEGIDTKVPGWSTATDSTVEASNDHIDGVDKALVGQFEGIDKNDTVVAKNADGKTNAKDFSRIKKS